MSMKSEQVAWLKGLLASGGPLTHRQEDVDMVNSIIASIKGPEGAAETFYRQRALTLEAQLRERPEATPWIACSERKPAEIGHYIGWDAGHGCTTAFFDSQRWKDCFGFEDSPITHWMPLLLPPTPQPLHEGDK